MHKLIVFISLSIFLISCGETNFAKRRYTEGVYIEKHSTAKSHKIKTHKEQKEVARTEVKQNEESPSKSQEPIASKTKQERPSRELVVEDQKIDGLHLENVPVEQAEYTEPPVQNDGEDLTRGKTKDSLGQASMILGIIAAGLVFFITVTAIILAILIYAGAVAGLIAGIVLSAIYYLSAALALAALITGAISVSKKRNKAGMVGLIIGAILVGIFLIALIFILIF